MSPRSRTLLTHLPSGLQELSSQANFCYDENTISSRNPRCLPSLKWYCLLHGKQCYLYNLQPCYLYGPKSCFLRLLLFSKELGHLLGTWLRRVLEGNDKKPEGSRGLQDLGGWRGGGVLEGWRAGLEGPLFPLTPGSGDSLLVTTPDESSSQRT